MKVIIYILAAVCGYFVSGINPAIALSKAIYKKDIRECGSGNPGFTNFKRTFGNKWAWWVLVLDLSKAAVVVGLFAWLLSRQGGDFQLGAAYTGMFCMLGHAFPFQFKFKGGKGIVVSTTAMFFADPVIGLIVFVVAISIMAISKYVSLGSVLGAVLFVICAFIFKSQNTDFIVFAMMLALLAIYMHKSNIVRLFNGTENKLNFKK